MPYCPASGPGEGVSSHSRRSMTMNTYLDSSVGSLAKAVLAPAGRFCGMAQHILELGEHLKRTNREKMLKYLFQVQPVRGTSHRKALVLESAISIQGLCL